MRDEEGNVVSEGGTFRDEEKTLLTVKFPKEARFCFGVAMKKNDGEDEGWRMPTFDYTQKKIITKKDSDERLDKEIARVRAMRRTTKCWLVNTRPDGVVYLNDPVIMVDGIGKMTLKKLNTGNIHTVEDLLQMDEQDIRGFTRHEVKEMRIPGLVSLIEKCRLHVVEENAPDTQSFLNCDNPYLAKYGDVRDEWGEEAWKTELKAKSPLFVGAVCITELVKHIVRCAQAFFKDTPFRDTYYFYHDALTQITHTSCVSWMETTPIPGEDRVVYDRWVKPELGINDQFGPVWH